MVHLCHPRALYISSRMKTASIQNLHQHWIAAGKQPVVFFSSQDLHTHPDNLAHEPIFGLSVLPVLPEGESVSASYIPVEIAESQPIAALPEVALTRLKPTFKLPSLPRFSFSLPSLPTISVPTFSLPRLKLPRLPSLPTLPSFTLPVLPALSTRQDLQNNVVAWPWSKVLHWGTRLAYAGALAALVLFLTPIVILEGESRVRQLQHQISNLHLQSQGETTIAPLEPTPSPEPEINNANDYFSVEFPRLQISSRIIPNVDTTLPSDYEAALKLGVAHAKGSGVPDDTSINKTIYLFAHSTNAAFNIQRYNAQFYALKDSVAGDEIKVRFWGTDYHYVVEEIKIVDANDTTYLQPQMDRELLILQTCYPPGTTWKRLIVIATKVPSPEGNAE